MNRNLLTFKVKKKENIMTLKEEFIKQTQYLIEDGVFYKSDRDAIWSWIEQQIKQACDQQKVICADQLKLYVDDDRIDGLHKLILNASYPEGVK